MPPQPNGIIPATGQPTLRQVRRQFPQFAIWREVSLDRCRYIARALDLGTNPHTVITDDLAELRDALSGKGQPAASSNAVFCQRAPDIGGSRSAVSRASGVCHQDRNQRACPDSDSPGRAR